MNKIIECVPNFSEGKDPLKIKKISESFKDKKGVKLLDCQSDENHNRMVVTAVGEPKPLAEALIQAVGQAIECIDMTKHKGQHPRMGAVDVIPFIPVKNVDTQEAIELSKKTGEMLASKFGLPVFLYEKSAASPDRANLADIRKGQFENMAEKLKDPKWKPDFGPAAIHPTAGVTAVGVRMPLIAYNVNLDTDNMQVADAIAKKVRHISGGLRYCKAIGVELKDRGQVQVSMNLTDFHKSSIYTVFEMIRMQARRYGVNIVGSEVVGLVPMEALIDSASYYLGLENFSMDQVLESRIMEE